MAPVLFVAASVGDTATVARWRERASGRSARLGLDAWAAVRAGDTALARRLLPAALRDTSRSVAHVLGLARSAQAVGMHDVALAAFVRMDSLSYMPLPTPDLDYVLLVRSYAERAASYEATGETEKARVWYERFLRLWDDADATARPIRDAAARRLAELARAGIER
jgi:Tfp pilus assembly protein PilF